MVFCYLHVSTRLWRRLIVPYQCYPFCLAALADPRLAESEHIALARQFLLSKPCCRDNGFSARLRSQMNLVEDLMNGGRLCGCITLLSHHKVTNIEIENNFARALSASKCARGVVGCYVNPHTNVYLLGKNVARTRFGPIDAFMSLRVTSNY